MDELAALRDSSTSHTFPSKMVLWSSFGFCQMLFQCFTWLRLFLYLCSFLICPPLQNRPYTTWTFKDFYCTICNVPIPFVRTTIYLFVLLDLSKVALCVCVIYVNFIILEGISGVINMLMSHALWQLKLIPPDPKLQQQHFYMGFPWLRSV